MIADGRAWGVARAFFGWRVVAGAFVLAVFGWGVGFYGPPVYLHAVREARGWPLAMVSAAVTVHFLIGAVVVANLPTLHQRFGVPAITKAGAILLGAGIAGWAVAQQPWQLFASTLSSGAGWAAMGAATVNAIVSPWFARGRPAALAMAYNGATIGGVVFSPLWVAAIAVLGFPAAAAAIGVVTASTMWMLSDRLFCKTPEHMGLTPDGDGPGATAPSLVTVQASPLPGSLLWRDFRFLTLCTGMALGLFAQVGLISHLFSLLVPALGPQGAGFAMGAATAAAIAGRTLVGWVMPVAADRRLAACASYAVQVAGSVCFLLAAGNKVPFLLIGVVLFGAGIGNATSLPPPHCPGGVRREGCAARGSPHCRRRAGYLCVRASRVRRDQRAVPIPGRGGSWGGSRLLRLCRDRTGLRPQRLPGGPRAILFCPYTTRIRRAAPRGPYDAVRS